MLSPGSRAGSTVGGEAVQTALLESIDTNILDIEVVLEGIDTKVGGLATLSEQHAQTAHLQAISDNTLNSANELALIEPVTVDIKTAVQDLDAKVSTLAGSVSALPTAITNGQRANAIGDRYGRLLVEHVDAGLVTFKGATFTTTQTGGALWTPASGKRICLLTMHLSPESTTAGLVTIWFGASGDTTYTEGTDQVVWQGHLIPSATVTLPVCREFPWGMKAITTDHVLRITTSAAINVRTGFYGYEFTP